MMADKTIDPRTLVKIPSLGTRIRDARKAAGYSQEALAERLDVTWKTVNRWERDKSAIRYGHLVQIGILCVVAIEVLIPGLIIKEV